MDLTITKWFYNYKITSEIAKNNAVLVSLTFIFVFSRFEPLYKITFEGYKHQVGIQQCVSAFKTSQR